MVTRINNFYSIAPDFMERWNELKEKFKMKNKYCVIELSDWKVSPTPLYLSTLIQGGKTVYIEKAATFEYPLPKNFHILLGFFLATQKLDMIQNFKIKVVEYEIKDYDLEMSK